MSRGETKVYPKKCPGVLQDDPEYEKYKKTILLKFNNNPLVECPGKLKQTNCSTVGELVKLSFKCNKCCKKFTFSNLESKRIKTFKTNGIESANLEVVIAWILKGRS